MLIPDPDFCPCLIPDLGSWIQKQQQKRGVNKKFLYPQISQNLKKIIFELAKKIIWPKNYCNFYPKIVMEHRPDPGSGSATPIPIYQYLRFYLCNTLLSAIVAWTVVTFSVRKNFNNYGTEWKEHWLILSQSRKEMGIFRKRKIGYLLCILFCRRCCGKKPWWQCRGFPSPPTWRAL